MHGYPLISTSPKRQRGRMGRRPMASAIVKSESDKMGRRERSRLFKVEFRAESWGLYLHYIQRGGKEGSMEGIG